MEMCLPLLLRHTTRQVEVRSSLPGLLRLGFLLRRHLTGFFWRQKKPPKCPGNYAAAGGSSHGLTLVFSRTQPSYLPLFLLYRTSVRWRLLHGWTIG
jgi:hypothetical protein